MSPACSSTAAPPGALPVESLHMPAPQMVGSEDDAGDDVGRMQEPSLSGSNSNSLLPSSAARTAGFQTSGFHPSGGPPPTREELLEQGVEAQQADALLVRMNEEEVLMQNFRCWILCFSCIVSLLMPAMLGILLWMGIEYVNNRHQECDVPLHTWVYVVFVVMVYNSTINRPGRTGSLITRVCCRWHPDPEIPTPMPLRVRVYNATVALAIFVWTCLGLHWVHMSGKNPHSTLPPCKEVAKGLYDSVKVYAAFNVAFTVFMYVNMIGFAQLLRAAMRRGLLHSSNAAPKGALEKNTETPLEGDPQLVENPTCSICLEDFDISDLSTVAKTKTCGHLFCKRCLQNWLQVNRNCPLCRQDLGIVH